MKSWCQRQPLTISDCQLRKEDIKNKQNLGKKSNMPAPVTPARRSFIVERLISILRSVEMSH
jgi:hypothetical protein